jgi:hypothetical protein
MKPQLGRQVHYISKLGPMHAMSPAIITGTAEDWMGMEPEAASLENNLGQTFGDALGNGYGSPEHVSLQVFGMVNVYPEWNIPHHPGGEAPGSWHWYTECEGRPEVCKRIVDVQPEVDEERMADIEARRQAIRGIRSVSEESDGSVRDPEEVQEQQLTDQVRESRERRLAGTPPQQEFYSGDEEPVAQEESPPLDRGTAWLEGDRYPVPSLLADLTEEQIAGMTLEEIDHLYVERGGSLDHLGNEELAATETASLDQNGHPAANPHYDPKSEPPQRSRRGFSDDYPSPRQG